MPDPDIAPVPFHGLRAQLCGTPAERRRIAQSLGSDRQPRNSDGTVDRSRLSVVKLLLSVDHRCLTFLKLLTRTILLRQNRHLTIDPETVQGARGYTCARVDGRHGCPECHS